MATTIKTIETPKRARALDTSGNNNHGQIYSGRALEFDGVTDYLDTEIAFSETTHTIAVWAKANNDGNSKTLVDARDGLTDGIKVSFKTDEKIQYKVNDAELDSDTSIPSVWTRIVVTYDGSTQKIYINGILDKSASVTKTVATTQTTKIGRKAYGTTNYHNGFMSDVQIWNTAWTQDDVTYDYLNPESLALNRGSTSLTNSNLKIWYPMQDGHRGQQSYILDASNTGLGDNILLNSTFDTSIALGSNGSGWAESIVGGTSAVTFNSGGSKIYYGGANARLRANNSVGSTNVMTVGTTYKLVYDVIENNGVTGNFYISNPQSSISYSVGTHTYYFTATAVLFQIYIGGGDTGDYIIVDNVYLYPVNDKNNATTVFYGDEQITDSKNRDFASASDWGVLNIAGGSLTEPSNKLQVVTSTDNEVEGTALAVGELTTPVIGRTYRISALLDNTAGATTPTIQFRFAGANAVNVTATDGSPSDGTIDTTEQEYYADIVAVNTSGSLVIQNVASTDSTTFTIDDVSVKEIGTASGWTDADQQLHIPQTALQSYNELAWAPHDDTNGFFVRNDDIASNTLINLTEGSMSWWAFIDSARAMTFWQIYDNAASNQDYLRSHLDANGVFDIARENGNTLDFHYTVDLDGLAWGSGGYTGRWIHFVWMNDNTTADAKLYVNGESVTVTATTETSNHGWTNFGTDSDTNRITLLSGDWGSGAGAMTEVSFWNKQLSQAEVNELYNGGKALDATTHSAYNSTYGSSSLKGYWRDNGLNNWTDLSGGGNNLTANNVAEADTMLIPQSVDSSRDSQGFIMNKPRNTSSLNLPLLDTVYSNSSDHVDVGTIFNNDIFSLCCWIKVPNTGVTQRIVDNRNDAVEGWQLYIDASGNIKFVIGDTSGGGTVTEDTLGDVDVDTWIHVAVTYAGSAGTISTYINGGGKQTSTATGVQNQSLITTAMKIGSRNFSDVEYGTKGQIDGVLFYTDVLSDAEVLRNYNATKASHTN